MATLQEIEAAIEALPRDQVIELSEWLQSRVDEQWDRGFEGDVRAGRLNEVAERALKEHQAGNSKDFPGDEE